MTIAIPWLIAGAVALLGIGCTLGFVIMAACAMAGRADDGQGE